MATGKLFLVAGASGSGKSTVIAAVAAVMPNFVVVKKATTRELRKEATEDTYFEQDLRDLKSNRRFLIYATNGNMLYGVDIEEVRQILASGKNALLVSVHHGARKQMEELLGRENVVEVFIHRDLSPAMHDLLLARGGMRRLVIRERIYEGLATGLYRPDYIILNGEGDVSGAVEQFKLIAGNPKPAPRQDFSTATGVLHIVVAATGTLRDVVQDAPFAIPGWGRTYCKKGTPSAAEAAANPVPTGWMEHSLFGRVYRLNPEEVLFRLWELGVAFVMFSDVASARQLQKLVEAQGFAAPIHYLHQDGRQVEDSVLEFPKEEWEPRLEHALALRELYERELVLESHPILLVNAEEGALDWCYRCINERPRRKP